MELIWNQTLDKRYACRVERLGEYRGQLSIEEAGKRLLTKTVSLAFGAKFGPDVDDVRQWEDTCVDFVDKLGD